MLLFNDLNILDSSLFTIYNFDYEFSLGLPFSANHVSCRILTFLEFLEYNHLIFIYIKKEREKSINVITDLKDYNSSCDIILDQIL